MRDAQKDRDTARMSKYECAPAIRGCWVTFQTNAVTQDLSWAFEVGVYGIGVTHEVSVSDLAPQPEAKTQDSSTRKEKERTQTSLLNFKWSNKEWAHIQVIKWIMWIYKLLPAVVHKIYLERLHVSTTPECTDTTVSAMHGADSRRERHHRADGRQTLVPNPPV